MGTKSVTLSDLEVCPMRVIKRYFTHNGRFRMQLHASNFLHTILSIFGNVWLTVDIRGSLQDLGF